jgi:hypothetical protein
MATADQVNAALASIKQDPGASNTGIGANLQGFTPSAYVPTRYQPTYDNPMGNGIASLFGKGYSSMFGPSNQNGGAAGSYGGGYNNTGVTTPASNNSSGDASSLTSQLGAAFNGGVNIDANKLNSLISQNNLTSSQISAMFPGFDLSKLSGTGVNLPGYTPPANTGTTTPGISTLPPTRYPSTTTPTTTPTPTSTVTKPAGTTTPTPTPTSTVTKPAGTTTSTPTPTPTGTDPITAAYQAGNYTLAQSLINQQHLTPQDVVTKYGLSQGDAATVAKNLGFTGDMSGVTYYTPPTPTPTPTPTSTSTSTGITTLPGASNTNSSVASAIAPTPTPTPTPTASTSIADQLASAYNSGDMSTVNNIIAGNSLTQSAIANMFPGYNMSTVSPAVNYYVDPATYGGNVGD